MEINRKLIRETLQHLLDLHNALLKARKQRSQKKWKEEEVDGYIETLDEAMQILGHILLGWELWGVQEYLTETKAEKR